MSDQKSNGSPSSEPVLIVSAGGDRLQIPPEAVERISRHVAERIEIEQESYSGPLAHPRHLKQFEDIVPGSAKQMIDNLMAESKARREREDRIVAAEIGRIQRGQWFGFTLAFLALGIATALIFTGRPIEGFATILMGIGTVAGAFLLQRSNENKDKSEVE